MSWGCDVRLLFSRLTTWRKRRSQWWKVDAIVSPERPTIKAVRTPATRQASRCTNFPWIVLWERNGWNLCSATDLISMSRFQSMPFCVPSISREVGSNFRIPRNSFTCHWIRIASIVLYLDLQSLPTHVSEAEMSCLFWSLARSCYENSLAFTL